MKPARLETARLLLRPWREADLAPWAALNADPRVMEFFPSPQTRAESDVAAANIRAHFERHGYGLWAVEIRASAEGEAIPFAGFVGLQQVRADAPLPFAPAVEVGWRLAHRAWGRGYATEGARAALDYAFFVLGLDEVVSFTAAINARSRRVMEKLGLVRDPAKDFDHPRVAAGHPLERHVLYRIRRPERS